MGSAGLVLKSRQSTRHIEAYDEHRGQCNHDVAIPAAGGKLITPALEYDPDEPEPLPEAMEQEPVLQEILGIISSRFTDFGLRPDNFLSSNTILCYDPANLNVRVQPDIYLSFGVEQAAIRRRKLYLPWEAGKPPDLALEVASESTSPARHHRQARHLRCRRHSRILAL